MKFPSKKLITKFLIELMAEILLSFLGLDDVANYSEFIFDYGGATASIRPCVTRIIA